LWTYDDVTIKKNYQKNLQAQKDKYSSIISNMNLGLLEVDRNDIIQYANQSFCEMSGYPLEELVGKKAVELLVVPESQNLLSEKNLKRTEGISDSYEVKVRTKSGKRRYWLISGAPNYDVNGNNIGSIGIHLDITHMKKLESQKEMLLKNMAIQNEHLNEYAHIVSHDLKSPLRNISALLSWTMEDFREKLGEESLRNLELMQAKVEKMDHLIESILKYASIDKGINITEKVDLNNVVKGILEMIYIPAHIKVIIKSKLPIINADSTRMQQLFQNLISNAVTYTDKSAGLIEIGYKDNNTEYVFSVKDNGIGIAKEHHEKIFKIFSTLGNYEKSTGIGLNIVKKVVELYEGKIWLESELGQGTTFYFSIKK
jgi:PAS domain S-box-containing protein